MIRFVRIVCSMFVDSPGFSLTTMMLGRKPVKKAETFTPNVYQIAGHLLHSLQRNLQ